jgi:hypothetical protein
MGWPGDTLTQQPRPLNFGSLDEHLTQYKADVIIACFGMGESYQGSAALKRFETDWRNFILHSGEQRYNGKTAPRLVMISPIAHENLDDNLADSAAHNKNIELYTDQMGSIAEAHKLPFVDLYHPTLKLMETNPSQKLTHNGIHLNQYGYWAVSQIISEALIPKYVTWNVELNAAEGTAKATVAIVDRIVTNGKGIRFRVTNRTLPLSPAPANSVVHAQFTRNVPKLTVTNLEPGRYMLTINGKKNTTGSHAEWAAGIRIVNSPSHQKTAELRRRVNEKNTLFFYRWRAHNSEYIVGRRTKPFGIVSFPPEMKQFDQLILEEDRKIESVAAPLPGQTWELQPVAR